MLIRKFYDADMRDGGGSTKPLVTRRSLLIIGIATGSGDVETWHFDDDDLCRKFCEQLVRSTGRSVIVVDGTEVGRYCLADLPVVYRANGG